MSEPGQAAREASRRNQQSARAAIIAALQATDVAEIPDVAVDPAATVVSAMDTLAQTTESSTVTVQVESAHAVAFATPTRVTVTPAAIADIDMSGDLQAELQRGATWETVAVGAVQLKLEEIVDLIDRSDLLALLDADDEKIVLGIKALLAAAVTTTDTPDRSVLMGPLRWLGRKAERFIDGAIDSTARLVGPAIVTSAALYVPGLHHAISELLQLAER